MMKNLSRDIKDSVRRSRFDEFEGEGETLPNQQTSHLYQKVLIVKKE